MESSDIEVHPNSSSNNVQGSRSIYNRQVSNQVKEQAQEAMLQIVKASFVLLIYYFVLKVTYTSELNVQKQTFVLTMMLIQSYWTFSKIFSKIGKIWSLEVGSRSKGHVVPYMVDFTGRFVLFYINCQLWTGQDNAPETAESFGFLMTILYYQCLLVSLGALLAFYLALFLACCGCCGILMEIVPNLIRANSRSLPSYRRQQSRELFFEQLHKIPYSNVILGDVADDGNICSICFEEFQQSDDVFQLACAKNHVFHYECLHQWILAKERNGDYNAGCPLCRAQIRTQ